MQARSGDSAGAAETVVRLTDPALKATVLAEMLVAQAKSGDAAEAGQAALQISDFPLRVATLCHITETIVAASKAPGK